MAARGSLTIIFPEQVQSVDTSSISSSSSITTSGESVTTTTDDGQTYSVAFTLVAGYKINGADFTPSVNGGIVDSFTDSTVDITAGAAGIDGTLTITVQQSESTTVKTVSSDNLARFKQKCDETYAKIGEGGGSDVEIPTPTTSDNGKVLGVINGAYSLLNLFPVGTYYITENATTPASLFGGEWVQVKSKFLLGASVQDGYPLGTEGGEKTHTLTIDEMPEHHHDTIGGLSWSQTLYAVDTPGSSEGGMGVKTNSDNTGATYRSKMETNYTGGNAAHNNMPPYRSVFIWRRTA